MTVYAGENVERGEHSSTAGGSANLYSHFGDQYGGSSGRMEISQPQDPAIPLLGIYPKDAHSYHKDICSLFAIARI